MKKTVYLIFTLIISFTIVLTSCKTPKESISISTNEKEIFNQKEKDTITISSDETEYEIIIIEPGFNIWLQSTARQKGFYSQSYMESRNNIYVNEWNRRVLQPQRFDPNLYEMQINYDVHTDYGYEVNYKLFNYFIYFQRKYNQRLGPFMPRI